LANLQRVIISILIVGVLTVIGLFALRPITALAEFTRKRADRVLAAAFGLVIGLSVPVLLFLLAMRLSSEFTRWVLQGPPPLHLLESEPIFLLTVAVSLGIPLLILVLLRNRASSE